MDSATTQRRATWIALTALAAVYAWMVWRFDWLCDDSFISFRYSRNLARGQGLVYNPGEQPPVEGFTNLLWVLWLAPFEALDMRVPAVARISSAACGLALFLVLGRFLAARATDWRAIACAMLVLVTLPPFAAWTTSGLETMPFALALFGTFAALFSATPKPKLAALSAVATLLLRADGFLFVGLALAIALAVAWRTHARALVRATLIAGGATAVAFAAHMLWRHAYYGEWAPNTARVKVEPGVTSLTAGWNYVVTFVLAYPATLIAAIVSVLALLRRRDAVATAALAVVLGVFGYALFVGGDFMAMGRFLVPALPFLTVAFASALASVIALSWRALASSTALVAACVALSLFAAFDVYAVPSSFRKSFRFRWNTDDWLTEYGQWGMMRAQASRWRLLGRALAAKTQPGESLVFGTIGAVGYYSDMTILDPYGLVSREPFEELDPAVRRSPGHQRRIALSTYLAKNPTYLEAQIVDRNERYAGLRRDLVAGGAYADVSAPEWLEIQDVPGAQRNQVLRLVRYRPR